MKLSHLLLMMFGTTAVRILYEWILLQGGMQSSLLTRNYIAFPGAFFVMLLLAWPISRLFRMTPLMIFAGPCPGCRRRPPGWWATEIEGKKLLLSCGTCGKELELWLTRTPPVGLVSATVPVFKLRWPEFLGIWREVRCQNDANLESTV
jgi:hypothetical protein